MTTATLTPFSAFEDARAKARAAAGAMVPLLAATLHAQFPDARFLVITRHETDYDGDYLRLNSVRGAEGEIVRAFPELLSRTEQLPAVPEEIAALWGAHDPRDPGAILGLAQRVEDTAPHDFLDFLPERARTDEEIEGENAGGRTPLGIALPCPCGAPGGECAPCCGSRPCPTVCSGCSTWRPEFH